MDDAINSMVGLGIGLGFGLYTLSVLNKLQPKYKTEIEKLLNKSQQLGNNSFVVFARNSNLSRAIFLLNKSGFRVVKTTKYGNITQIIFKEKQ